MTATRTVSALVALCSIGCAFSDDAPRVGVAREAIVEGWNDDGDPAAVALMRAGALVCSGTLIAPDVVLTAAHCVDLLPPESAAFGPQPGAPTDEIPIVRAVAHPRFERATLAHDIAILRLAYDADAPPALLPDEALEEERIGSQVRIVGFGVFGVGGETDLRKRAGFSRVDTVDHDTFTLSGEPSQPCVGDSGGPTFVRMGDVEPIAGVHSGGSASCVGGSIETRVDAHLDFIAEQMPAAYRAPGTHGGLGSGCSATEGDPGVSCALLLMLLVMRFRSSSPRFDTSRPPTRFREER